jgi:superfamily II RNA helicase
MMGIPLDIPSITAAIGAASSAVALFDKITDQVERFITKKPAPEIPIEHRMKIEASGPELIAKEHGQVTQRITAEQLQHLPAEKLRHVKVFEQSMENHYRVWETVYPQLALLDSPIQKARVELQIGAEVRDMKGDLEGILSFLESCGLGLDDHYQKMRHLIKMYAESASSGASA